MFVAAAALLASWLAFRLTRDPLAALTAAAVYALSPLVRTLALADTRLAACLLLLPTFLLLFYRASSLPGGEASPRGSFRWAPLAVLLAALGLLDTRFAGVAGFALLVILLTGFAMDGQRRSAIWGPKFLGWVVTCVGGALLYAPLWWWRRLHPGALGGPLPPVPGGGIDFALLWRHSPGYLGIAALLLAAAGVLLSRSYRAQARLWAVLAGISLWAALGSHFRFAGKYLWWIPTIGRLFDGLPWLGGIPPAYFAAVCQLALAMLASFGLLALLSRLPLKYLRWRWFKPLIALLATALIAIDYYGASH